MVYQGFRIPKSIFWVHDRLEGAGLRFEDAGERARGEARAVRWQIAGLRREAGVLRIELRADRGTRLEPLRTAITEQRIQTFIFS